MKNIEIEDYEIRQKIINQSGNIVVSADAGTGKTTLMSQKIIQDMEHNLDFMSFAAITFTNKAAKEISDKLGNFRKQRGFIGTSDKFVLDEVIIPFISDVFSELQDVPIKVDFGSEYKRYNWESLLKLLKEKMKIGSYIDIKKNFIFQLALFVLRESYVAKRYLKSKYYCIYIDEYQDSDKDMHNFFMYLSNELNISLFIVGDEKQSIYEWRGGYPDGFKQLKSSSEFVHFKLTHNFRSNWQVQNYSNLFNQNLHNSLKSDFHNENQVSIIKYSKNDVIKEYLGSWIKSNSKVGFLCYKNTDAEKWANNLAELGFVYIPRVPLEKSDLDSSQSWIMKSIANYLLQERYSEFSFWDEIPQPQLYEIEKIFLILKKIKQLYEKLLLDNEMKVCIQELYQYLLGDYNIESFEIEIKSLYDTLKDKKYKMAYNKEFYDKVIITVHSAKGLQYNQVILQGNDYIYDKKLNEEMHYVATTRAENELLILLNSNNECVKYFNIIEENISRVQERGINIKIENIVNIKQLE